MEVLARNLPSGMTERSVKEFFTPYLAQIGIHTYHCHKISGKTFAKLTFADSIAGNLFFQLHGQSEPGRQGFASVKVKLFYLRNPVNVIKSHHFPDKFLLSSLESEDTKRVAAHQHWKPNGTTTKPSKLQRTFDIRQIFCGQWGYTRERLVFFSHFQEDRIGRMVFGRRSILVFVSPRAHNMPGHQIDISYASIESFTTGTRDNPSVTFSLAEVGYYFSASLPLSRPTQSPPGACPSSNRFPKIRLRLVPLFQNEMLTPETFRLPSYSNAVRRLTKTTRSPVLCRVLACNRRSLETVIRHRNARELRH